MKIKLYLFLFICLAISSYSLYILDNPKNGLSDLAASSGSTVAKYLSIGSSSSIIDISDGVFIKDEDMPVLTLGFNDGKLMVSTTIRDSSGETVAKLADNEWLLNKNNFFDKNYTDTALEIIDQTGHAILQVVHLGEIVYLTGIFHCRNQLTTVFYPVSKDGPVIEISPPGVEPNISILPIFEYPSSIHLGSCPGMKSLEERIAFDPGNTFVMDRAFDICGIE